MPEIVGSEAAYLSEAPQAEPQAAGFSSGLSEAPQAVPQAAATSFSFQPAKFESAIFHYLHCELFGTFPVP